MERWIKDIFPIMEIENDCIISVQGDITIGFEVELPEIFSLSNSEYEAFHQAWVKAIRVLPANSAFCKQDWFLESGFKKAQNPAEVSFLSTASDRFFENRPFLEHQCYIFLTQKPENRKGASSTYSSLMRKSIVPEQLLDERLLQEFTDICGQFRRIMVDSGFVKMNRLTDQDLKSSKENAGIVERYCFLASGEEKIVRDIVFGDDIRIGEKHCQLYALADVEELPAMCGSRINYEPYSTDRTKFSIGFPAQLGQLLHCNHIYSQYVFIGEPQVTLKKMESKRLRLQSLSAYSRENAISRDAVNEFLNEAISQQRLPVKAHFNVLVWSDQKSRLKEIKQQVSSAFAQMDAVAKIETAGAPQIFWAGIPGNAADFPANDTFDTFAEQASCFFNQETGYKDSPGPFGMRMGDRLTGKPVNTDISDWPLKMGYTTARNKFILGPSGACRAGFH